MLHHFNDYSDDKIIGFYQINVDPKKFISKFNKLYGSSFITADIDHYSDIGDFQIDTLVIHKNYFCDELMELLDFGIYIYIVDY